MSRLLGNLLRRQVSSGTRIIAASSWISDTLPFGGLWLWRAKRNQLRDVRSLESILRHNSNSNLL